MSSLYIYRGYGLTVDFKASLLALLTPYNVMTMTLYHYNACHDIVDHNAIELQKPYSVQCHVYVRTVLTTCTFSYLL